MAVLVTLNRGQRQGSFATPGYIAPSDWTGTLSIRPQIDEVDWNDPTKSLALRLYRLDPATQTWVMIVGTRWFGGSGLDYSDPTNHPAVSTSADDLRGREIRGEMDVPERMRAGCIVELV